jgi:DNA primase
MFDSPIDEIKSRLDIVEVVREYIPNLKQAGSNWKALCPFHNEKTPSFMVSQDKQIWHCFGCGKGGDVFGFIMEIENVEFPEALKILAKKAGVTLKYQDPKLINQKTLLLDILDAAAKFYHRQLLNSSSALKAREYLFNIRKLNEETIEEFNLGFASSSWDDLLKFLLKSGFREKDIFLAGLIIQKERGVGFYDRFRERIMFPIRDHHGRTVGFTGRLLPEKENETEAGKYVNTPQTLVYNKSQVIYGLDRAKQAIKKENLVVIVEGNMDVIASHQAGVKNVVASSGTSLTVDQVKLLKRYSNNLAISFDADAAGQTALRRGIDIALENGMTVKVIALDSKIGKDPDEYIKKDVKNWLEAISKAELFMDYYFNLVLKNFDLRKVEDKKEVTRLLLAEVAKLPNKVEQMHYLQKLSELLNIPEQILYENLPSKSKVKNEKKQEIKVDAKKDKVFLLEQRLLALILKFPQNIKFVIDRLTPENFKNSSFYKIYKQLILCYNEYNEKFDDQEFISFVKERMDKSDGYILDTLALLAEKDYSEFDTDEIREEIQKSVKLLQENYLSEKRNQLANKLKEAEKRGDYKMAEELLREFNRLLSS